MAQAVGGHCQDAPQGRQLQLVELPRREDRRGGGRLEEGHVQAGVGDGPAKHRLVLGQAHEEAGRLVGQQQRHPGRGR